MFIPGTYSEQKKQTLLSPRQNKLHATNFPSRWFNVTQFNLAYLKCLTFRRARKWYHFLFITFYFWKICNLEIGSVSEIEKSDLFAVRQFAVEILIKKSFFRFFLSSRESFLWHRHNWLLSIPNDNYQWFSFYCFIGQIFFRKSWVYWILTPWFYDPFCQESIFDFGSTLLMGFICCFSQDKSEFLFLKTKNHVTSETVKTHDLRPAEIPRNQNFQQKIIHTHKSPKTS